MIFSTIFIGKEEKVKPPSQQEMPVVQKEVKVTAPEKEVSPKQPNNKHPLSKFTFFVVGQSKQFVRPSYEDEAPFDKALNFYRVYLDAYENNKKMFTIEHNDLVKFGYGFKKIADCFYELSYGDFSQIVTCGEIAVPKDGIEALGANLF